MFDMDIMNHAEIMGEMGHPFESVQIFLQREGYDLLNWNEDLAGREHIFTLGNGWVVCELV